MNPIPAKLLTDFKYGENKTVQMAMLLWHKGKGPFPQEPFSQGHPTVPSFVPKAPAHPSSSPLHLSV